MQTSFRRRSKHGGHRQTEARQNGDSWKEVKVCEWGVGGGGGSRVVGGLV